MKILTPEQFVAKTRNLTSMFEVELFRAKQEMGHQAVNHFKRSFDREGFIGGGDKWAPRVDTRKHPLLNKTGVMKNSLFFTVSNAGGMVVIQTNSPYAHYHNNSTRTSHSQGMGNYRYNIQRQFVGDSKWLEKWTQDRLQKVFTYTFR